MITHPTSVLVAAASRYGSTAEIARAIGDVLVENGFQVDVKPASEVSGVDGYDACVIGSAVYIGQWRKLAKELVLRNAEALRQRPVWLFSSGPVGEPPKPDGDPSDTAAMVQAVAPRGHRVFAGRLDKSQLGFLEKRVVRAVKAQYGDYREWDEIRGWAAAIAQALKEEPSRAER